MEEFINLQILGRGDHGEITKKVRSKKDQKLYVLKKYSQKQLTSNQNKILDILCKNECPFIVKHYLCEKRPNEIKTDFINNGDLQEYINTLIDLNQFIDESTLWKIFLQCVESVKYIHSKDIIHRNIRLENFYMNNDMEIKLGNFKYATIKSENGKYENDFNNPEGGIFYKSEKTLNNSIYNEKSDIYSLGVMFYYLCFFQFPYEPIFIPDPSQENQGEMKLTPFPDDTKKNLDKYSDDMKNLINQMISKEENRPNLNNIYQTIKEKYEECSLNNTSIEEVFRCFSSFNELKLRLDKIKPFDENKYPVISSFYYSSDEFKKENEGNKNNKNYKKFINLFRKAFEQNNPLKLGEEARPFEVAKFFVEKYTNEAITVEKVNPNDNDENKKKIISDIEKYFKGEFNLPSDNNNNICIFNSLSINLEKCTKDSNTKKYELSTIIANSLSKGDNIYFKEKLIIPRYLFIFINRGQNYKDTSAISFPKEFTNSPGKYVLTGFIKRMIKEGKKYFISVNEKVKGVWMLSEKNILKKIDLNEELNNSDGLVEIIFYKEDKGKKTTIIAS